MARRQIDRVRFWLRERLSLSPTVDLKLQPESSLNESCVNNRRRLLSCCAIVFVIALGIRFLYWQDAYAEISRNDSTIQTLAGPYRDEAGRMLESGGILYPSEPIDSGDARLILHPPGYAVLMAAFTKLFGDPDGPLRFTQVVLASLQTAIVVLIAAEMLPLALAIIAGALAALSPHLAYYSIFLSPDSLAVLPILIALYLIIRATKKPRLSYIIGAGIFAGISCWLRSNALLLPFFLSLVIFLLIEREKRRRYSLALLAAALLVIAPITARNWIIYGRFIPVSIGSGVTLLEGIAEYDDQHRFGLPVLDPDVLKEEEESSGRSDYGESLFVPDGIERDRSRFSRGIAVIRSNPTWFAGVMLRRMSFMLRFNDFRFENARFNSPLAPVVSANPNFGHHLSLPENASPAWSRSMSEEITDGTFVSSEASASVDEQDRALQIIGDGSDTGDQFVSLPIAVQKGTDYILALEVKQARGAMNFKVRTADPRIILATSRIRERKNRRKALDINNGDQSLGETTYLHFASGDSSEIRIAISNDRVTAIDKASPDRPVVQLGRADLFQIGATPHGWTHYPRLLIRGIQRNLYKTEWMWLFIGIGTVLLALARRDRVLLILSAVPAYYLIVQSILHTEYRYILAIHYFMFIFAATTFYIASMTIRWRLKSNKASIGE